MEKQRKRAQIAWCTAKYATPPNVGEKTFANSYKTLKFVKVESFEVTESCWIERGYIDVPFTE